MPNGNGNQAQDPAQGILAPLSVPRGVKAQAWEAYHGSQDQSSFERAVGALAIPREAKAALWDAKFGGEVEDQQSSADQPPETLGQRFPRTAAALRGAEDVGIGAAKGAGSTLNAIGGYTLLPVARALRAIGVSSPTVQALSAAPERPASFQPRGLAQKVGYGVEQAGEFLAPGGAEEELGRIAGRALPEVAAAAPVARTAASAVASGLVNKLQGGSFKGGAALGAGTGTMGEALRAIAPSVAESALGIGKRLRGFGRTPGKAALEEISGVSPETVGANAGAKIEQLTGELENAAARSTTPVSTAPAVQVVDGEMKKALSRNDRAGLTQLHDLRQQLTQELVSDSQGIRFEGELPGQLPASRLLDIKRGIGNLEKSWNPETRGAMRGVVRKVYGALDREVDRAVPESADLNQRISSLIPVAQRAESIERGAGLPQRIGHRLAAHTGALTGAVAGGYLGERKGGVLGAIAGGAVGLAAPEILTSPTLQMLIARAAKSPESMRALRGVLAQMRGTF
jgi:hypothetical protein